MTLADKIVVLRDGRVEQVGTPIDLYEKPDNRFVAQFIGSPKMNFFDASDLEKGAKKVLGREIDDTIHVGMRPEHLVESRAAGAVVKGNLELVENLGEYALVHLTTPAGKEFIAKTERPPKAKVGASMYFTLDGSQAHYFDKESGTRD